MGDIDIFLERGSAFEEVALAVFRYQYGHQPIYRLYCDLLHRAPQCVHTIQEIPFLPVRFFKSHCILTESLIAQRVFESSTTTGGTPSRHFVADLGIYQQSYLRTFEQFYGDVSQYDIFALLPSYMERGTSSLLYMVDDLIKRTDSPRSRFFGDEFHALAHAIACRPPNRQLMMIGVTYALLDFAEAHAQSLTDAIVMETGGMKGRREELTRAEIHNILCTKFGVATIHSEYGMTELLSQAYSNSVGIFRCPPQMRVMARDMSDPLACVESGRVGALNIIDLANLHSCSFLAVEDMGVAYSDGSFEVMGRMDASEARGCNLLYTG